MFSDDATTQKCLFLVDFFDLFNVKGAGGPRPKMLFYAIFVVGKQSNQMLFTKNIDLSRIYCIFKIAKYIQLP